MISQMEFVRRVDVQTETIERYVREGKLIPDLVVPMSEHRIFKYFKEETVKRYAEQYGWTLIDDSNRKELFLEMVHQMDMNYSYKPILLKAILKYADNTGKVRLDDIVSYFRKFFDDRRNNHLKVEKAQSVYLNPQITDKEILRNILTYPFKRFEAMSMLRHTKTLGVIQVDGAVWKHLSAQEKENILVICDEKLKEYFGKI